MTAADKRLASLTEAEARELFPYSWAMEDLRRLTATSYRYGSSLQAAEWRWRDTGDDMHLRELLTAIIAKAQEVLDTLDEPVSAAGKLLLERGDRG